MTETERADRNYQENLRRLKHFRLIDDEFFSKCFEGDTACVELVLRILLDKPSLKVLEVRTQVFLTNLLHRSVRLDILATDDTGTQFNIEIQRSDKGAGRARARCNSSLLDAHLLQKGEDFDTLPETWVIFITEHDVIGKGRPLYPVARCFLETGERFEDGSHILYVNGAYRGDTPIGKLMHDFFCTDPSDMYYQVLADRTRFFKESKEGTAIMSKIMEELMEKSMREGERNRSISIAKKMLASGRLDLEEIAEYVGLSLEEIKNLI